MEDTYAAEVPLAGTSGAVSLFAVYDGHGGAEVARFSALHMGRAIRNAPSYSAAFPAAQPPDATAPPSPPAAASDPAAAPTDPCPSPASTTADGPDLDLQDPRQQPQPHAGHPPCPWAPDGGCDPRPPDPDAPTSAAAAAGSSGAAGSTASSPRGVGSFSSGHTAPAGGDGGGDVAATASVLREAFLSLDRQLADESHARELMALANPGALTAPPELYGRRTAGGPFVGPAAGSTATVALVAHDRVTVAAVGDSRCILGSRAGGVVAMSVDHKATDPAERARVINAGCWVSASGRVCGELDMSRALGDADMKQAPGLPQHLQAVSPEPSVSTVELRPLPEGPRREGTRNSLGSGRAEGEGPEGVGSDGGGCGTACGLDGLCGYVGRGDMDGREGDGGVGPGGAAGPGAAGMGREAGGEGPSGSSSGGGDEGCCYLLLASDGLWNVMDNDKVHEFVMERLEAELPPENVCAQLCVEACVSEGTAYDNVTVLLVLLHGRHPVPTRGSDELEAADVPAAQLSEASAQEEVAAAAEADAGGEAANVGRVGADREAMEAAEPEVGMMGSELELCRMAEQQVASVSSAGPPPAISISHQRQGGRALGTDGMMVDGKLPRADGRQAPQADGSCRVWLPCFPHTAHLPSGSHPGSNLGSRPIPVSAGCVHPQPVPCPLPCYGGVAPCGKAGGAGGEAGVAERLLEASPVHDEAAGAAGPGGGGAMFGSVAVSFGW